MTPETFVDVAEVLVAIVVLLWFFSRQWRVFLTDVSRHHYFTLRERLFLMAADGRIEFSNAAYRDLRHKLNVHIRFAHTDTVERFITIAMHGPLHGRSPESQRLRDSIGVLEDAAVKSDLQKIFQTANDVRISHMVASSPVLCLLAVVIALPIAVALLVRKPTRIWITGLREIMAQVTRGSVAIADTIFRYQSYTSAAHVYVRTAH